VRRFVDRQAAGPPSLAARAGALLGSLFGGDGASGGDGPQGLYLVGPVGTGKTHLLAATYHALTPEVPAAFLHASTLFRLTEHPTAFAARVADRARVVCLDEVEIDDAANEARLVLVLQHFEQRGVQLLATSNVEPEDFLANQIGPGRFRRFLRESFGGRYEVVFVGGEDYRRRQELARDGRGWIGPPEATRAALDAALAEAEAQGHAVQRLTFAELLHQATEVAHERLIERLAEADRLAVEGIAITGTDDALRLLRLIDALYTRPDAPALFFTAEAPPEAWFDPDAHAGLAKGIAEKFTRTVSRLYAMCEVTVVGAGA
jgi:cell division protein ZapE